MAADLTWRTVQAVWIIATLLTAAYSQTVAPSNSTLPSSEHTYALQTTEVSMITSFTLDALTSNARLGSKQALRGPLFLATPQSASSVPPGGIAYISCDPSAYAAGNIDATRTINLAVNNNPHAIILFSNTSTHCNFTATDSFHYDVIYSMIEANVSSRLQIALSQGQPSGQATIQMVSNNDNNTDTEGDPAFGGHSPTTAVAMIILYSITGIITALFLIIIVVGAVRAHRHPERYGPRNIIGRARQSRARGIARAMLDTLPIVKFGEREDKPMEHGQDVELGGVQRDHPPANETESRSEDLVTTPEDHARDDEPEPVTTETALGAEKVADGQAPTENSAENGLACSVCVDDFVKGQDIRVLPCNHKFHPECIDPWLLNVSGTCPLCRVDLRPTASHTSHDSATYISRPASPDQDLDDINQHLDDIASGNERAARALSDQPTGTNTRSERRRSRTGLSTYIQHTLNRGRMRDATPEERVAALRRLRTVDQNEEAESSRAINRLSARLSRAFDGDRRRGSYAG